MNNSFLPTNMGKLCCSQRETTPPMQDACDSLVSACYQQLPYRMQVTPRQAVHSHPTASFNLDDQTQS